MARKDRQPKKGAIPPPSARLPATNPTFKDPNDLRPILSYKLMDVDGPWCFSKASPRALQIAMERLYNITQTTWRELSAGGSHFIDKDGIIQTAQDRLEEIGLGDYEKVYSLRCIGRIRIFGVRDREVFHLLWLDEFHAICPSERKGT